MEIKKVGYFKELRHGDKDGESLYDVISSKPQEHEVDIIKYLESGLVLAACGGVVDDILDPGQKAIATPSALTDGIWGWPGDLVYYVKRYHAKLNYEFVSYMEKSEWYVNQELIDVDKSVSEMTDLEKWAVFFEYASEPTYRETVNKVIESKEVLQMAGNLLMSISQDERERAIFRSRRIYQTDRESDMATAEDRGGKRKALAIAKNLLSINLPTDQIIIATGLTHEEVENLKV